MRRAGPALAWIVGMFVAATARGDGFDAIDQHALRAPAAAETSIPDLAAYLIAPARNDTERARAVFRWITDRITYDVDVLRGGPAVYEGPETVLQTRRSICRGYAGLFEDLARAAGLEAATISGYGKAYGYTAGDRFTGPADHAWNAVRRRGEWQLLDCTWGAGWVDEKGEYQRGFDEHYFLTPADRFIWDHFPTDERWQLLDPPLTLAEFERRVVLHSVFFHRGLHDPSRTDAILRADDELRLTLGAPPGIAVSARLSRDGRPLDETLVLAQRTGSRLEIRALPPGAGTYLLDVFAGRAGEPQYEWAMQYRVVTPPNGGGAERYPEILGSFHAREATLESPFTGRLRAGGRETFRLRVPAAEKAAAVQGDTWTPFARRGEVFDGPVDVTPGELLIVAKFPGEEDYDVLLRYIAE